MFRAWFRKRSNHCEKVMGSFISCQLTISLSDRFPRTILLRSDHDPGDPTRNWDRCWIRDFIKTIGHFISYFTIVKIHKLPGNIYWNIVCLVSTVCIFSMTLNTYTCLPNMVCPNRVVSRANTVCVLNWPWRSRIDTHKWRSHTPHCDFFIQSRPRNFNSKFPSEWFMSWFNWQ